ncbi:sulfate ABC transporter substrate-binding protein [Cellvibrio sp.]|uniref:sulfate ABC transporter substrate-binding protein n=1 Tax=Cellvibrio sp. TaxID=1965322 RepID=UPI0039647D55
MNAIKKLAIVASALLLSSGAIAKEVKLLNVSYDPTRELYREYNTAFSKYWQAKTGDTVKVEQSHGGSGAQSRAVIDGLQADVVTFALAGDIDPLYKFGKLIPEDWQTRLPQSSAPYTSTIVFLVRKGNPKQIKDWDDLIKKNVEVITPNPKTSGGARWNYLAAWGFAKKKFGSDQAAQDFVKKLFKNVPVLDSGARGATTTFVQRQIGDVLLTWENEAFLAVNELGADKVEIVVPSVSILAEASITVVDKYADAHGTRQVAEEYLKYLYTKEGQNIIAKNYYRPRDKEVLAAYGSKFPKIELFTIEDFGGWKKAQPEHFGDGGIFDKIYQ